LGTRRASSEKPDSIFRQRGSFAGFSQYLRIKSQNVRAVFGSAGANAAFEVPVKTNSRFEASSLS
jgi:hypothetical protein